MSEESKEIYNAKKDQLGLGCKPESDFASLLLDCVVSSRNSLGAGQQSAEEKGSEAGQSARLIMSQNQNGVKSTLQNQKPSVDSEPGSIEVTLEPEQTEAQLSETETSSSESEEESDDSEEEEETVARKEKKPDSTIPYIITAERGRLCSECGAMYRGRKTHTCQHKLKPLVCNMCGRRYANEMALKIHSKAHTDNAEHRCWCCYAVFKTKREKDAHKQIHRNQLEPYQCRHCPSTFSKFADRTKHNKIHRGPFEYKCAICGISFWVKQQLERHMVVHTGERPYKCSFCERGFNQEGHLRSHMRLHTGERPYACNLCDKAFNHNVSLKSHMKRYHPSDSESPGTTEVQEDKSSDAALKKPDTQKPRETAAGTVDEKQPETLMKRKKKRPATGRPLGRPKRPDSKKTGGSQSTSRQDTNSPYDSSEDEFPS